MNKQEIIEWLKSTKNLSYLAGGCGILMMEIMCITVSLPYTLLANIFVATGVATFLKTINGYLGRND